MSLCPNCERPDPPYDPQKDKYWCPCGWEDIDLPPTFSCDFCGETELDEYSKYVYHLNKWNKVCRKCN